MVGNEKMKTNPKAIPNLRSPPPAGCMRLEDQIMERALVIWRIKGHGHQNALKALLQAEREILTQKTNELKAAH